MTEKRGRVLITGATGFIGRHAPAALRRRGYDVSVLGRRRPDGLGDDVPWFEVDLLRSEVGLAVALAWRPTHLLHFAWFYEPGAVYNSVENVRWTEASLRLLREFSATPHAQRAVVAGTCAEYGATAEPCDETITAIAPATLYGLAKQSVAALARPVCDAAGVSFSWGRVFFVFGPAEHPARLVSSVAIALLEGREAPCSHGTQVRDFMYAPETADAFAALLDSDVVGPVNVGSGERTSIREIVEHLAAVIGRPELLRLGAIPARPHEQQLLVPDMRRLRDEVGWQPSSSVHEGLDRTAAWWRGQLTA